MQVTITKAPKISVKALRSKYCHPTSAKCPDGVGPRDYCVGGALCMALGKALCKRVGTDARFPRVTQLRKVLQLVNPKLNNGDASSYAHSIIRYNDAENFGIAWDWLKHALRRK